MDTTLFQGHQREEKEFNYILAWMTFSRITA